jgi:hypothetical protein
VDVVGVELVAQVDSRLTGHLVLAHHATQAAQAVSSGDAQQAADASQ